MRTKFHWNVGKDHPKWKGDKAKYSAIHMWIRSHKPKPKKCEHCKKIKKLEWANKSRKYKRTFKDWLALCKHCHTKYDFPLKNKHRNKLGQFID